jgi:hypothetical protein
MSKPTRGRLLAMIAVSGTIGLAVGFSAIGQEGRPRQVLAAVEGKTKATAGWRKAESCGVCHREISAKDHELLPRLREIGDFVLFNEYATWAKDDVHSQSYLRLTTARAQEMAGKLGYDVQKDSRCLSCHAPGFADAVEGESIKAEGVTCVACHGAHTEWVGKHGEDFDRWVKLPGERKWLEFGMRDLRDPAVRAGVCVSCHVGSQAEGRIITHDMYVAGHPPLSGWESTAWAAGMPRHWRATTDVPYLRSATKEIRANYHLERADFEQTRLTLAGGIAVLAGSLDLLEAHAASRAAAKAPEAPEFARFDCRACHHDLRRDPGKPSWRQARGFAAAPGRPPLPDWTLVLVPLAIEAAAQNPAEAEGLNKAFRAALKDVDTALGARPFGASERTATSCRQLTGWLNKLSVRLDRASLDRAKVIRLLRTLAEMGRAEAYDFDSSRQIAWAFESLYRDVVPEGSRGAEPRAIFEAWKRELATELPQWRGPALHDTLAEYLNIGAEFDPGRFRQQMSALLGAIPAE